MHLARSSFVLFVVVQSLLGATSVSAKPIPVGFAKRDITPNQPVRLSGYADRATPHEGVDQPLFVRAIAMAPTSGNWNVLVSIDAIGMDAAQTKKIADEIESRMGIPRSHLVICFTHSHTAPHPDSGLSNLFTVPLTAIESDHARTYTARVRTEVVTAVDQAIAEASPGTIEFAQGEVGFAINRRVLRDGNWVDFGERPDGPVDHTLPILVVRSPTGEIRGIVFNYACHCTTFHSTYNRVNGDWSGYAAEYLEQKYPQSTALCTIGCGGDANPPRVEAHSLALAQQSGRQIANEIVRLIEGPLATINGPFSASYGYAGLPVDRPSLTELEERLTDRSIHVRRHAEAMIAMNERKGRLPETYPAPVQVWNFGEQLTMVFLSGEVVADYALRLRGELKSQHRWISAYANDIFGYVASERMRPEGGYEVDGSMIYYNQPGPWAAGTEEVLIRRVHELVAASGTAGPFGPDEALATFHVGQGYKIETVASEPLIEDPINFCVDEHGYLWVVEMRDYPGNTDENGPSEPLGRVKVLRDTDGDGSYDHADLFIDKIAFPTGIMPWRDGVLICAAPDIFLARDTDGDFRSDHLETLFTDLPRGNPQHQVNGFTYGLDHWLYLAKGDATRSVTEVRSGKTIDARGRDLRIDPDRGVVEAVSGQTQYGRARTDWGDWFGSTNSEPLFHYPISDQYLKRNPNVTLPRALVHQLEPHFAPPVFPTSRTIDRFNDLFAADRVTSACGATIWRDVQSGSDVNGSAFVCEPVHNLVMRIMLERQGGTFRGSRHRDDADSEFLSSRDNWFRPVWAITGPDGGLWIADMYRHVIEHPEWIPDAWQEQLNLRAGQRRGRIYRVVRNDLPNRPIPNLAKRSCEQLTESLNASSGWERDTAQRLLIERNDATSIPLLRDRVASHTTAAGRLHALCTLHGMKALDDDTLVVALRDADPGVCRWAVAFAEDRLDVSPHVIKQCRSLTSDQRPDVALQLALSLGEYHGADRAGLLAELAHGHGGDAWVRAALVSSATECAKELLDAIVPLLPDTPRLGELVSGLVTTATTAGDANPQMIAQVISSLVREASPQETQPWKLTALATLLKTVEAESDSGLATLPLDDATRSDLDRLISFSRSLAMDRSATVDTRIDVLNLLGRIPSKRDSDRDLLIQLLDPTVDIRLQSAAVSALREIEGDGTATSLIERWRSYSPQTQAGVLEVLLSRSDWASAILSAIDQETISPSDLDANARMRLLAYPSWTVRSRAEQILSRWVTTDRFQVVRDHQDVLQLEGRPVAGAAIFAKKCAACHRFRGVGFEVGAPLAALQDKSSPSLIIAILDPNRAVEQQYRSYSAVTQDGQIVTGRILSETANDVTFALADGSRRTILRAQIDEMSNTGKSFMPEGLEQDLTRQDLADVIAYLQENVPDGAGDGLSVTPDDGTEKQLGEAASPQ